MVISLSTIRVSSHNSLYNFLQTGTYALSTNNIHEYVTDSLVRKEGYPQVQLVIKVSEDKLTFGADGLYEVGITLNIQIRHNSVLNSKTVADEVHNKIRSGKATLRTLGFSEIKFEFDDYDFSPYGTNQTEHRYTLIFTAKYRGSS